MENKRKLVVDSYEELEFHLKNCIHWDSTDVAGQYDLVGITGLLSATLDNLRKNTNQSELEDLRELISEDNQEFLKKISGTKS